MQQNWINGQSIPKNHNLNNIKKCIYVMLCGWITKFGSHGHLGRWADPAHDSLRLWNIYFYFGIYLSSILSLWSANRLDFITSISRPGPRWLAPPRHRILCNSTRLQCFILCNLVRICKACCCIRISTRLSAWAIGWSRGFSPPASS